MWNSNIETEVLNQAYNQIDEFLELMKSKEAEDVNEAKGSIDLKYIVVDKIIKYLETKGIIFDEEADYHITNEGDYYVMSTDNQYCLDGSIFSNSTSFSKEH